MFTKAVVWLSYVACAAVAQAANIPSLLGPKPFGFGGFPLFVQSWNQTTTYTNVSITMPLADLSTQPGAGVKGTVYLMRQIGVGTTTANEVVAPVSITGLTGASVTRTLFSGLTLAPGNSYMVLVPTSATPPSLSPFAASTPTVAVGSGVTALGTASPTTTASYPSATNISVSLTENNLIINVTGDAAPVAQAKPVATPALNTTGLRLLLLMMIGAGLFTSGRNRQ